MPKRRKPFDFSLAALFAFVFLLSTPKVMTIVSLEPTLLLQDQTYNEAQATALFSLNSYLTHRLHGLLLLIGWYAVIMTWPALKKKLDSFNTWLLLPALLYSGMLMIGARVSSDWYVLRDLASLACCLYLGLAFGLYAKQRLLATTLLLSCCLIMTMGIVRL